MAKTTKPPDPARLVADRMNVDREIAGMDGVRDRLLRDRRRADADLDALRNLGKTLGSTSPAVRDHGIAEVSGMKRELDALQRILDAGSSPGQGDPILAARRRAETEGKQLGLEFGADGQLTRFEMTREAATALNPTIMLRGSTDVVQLPNGNVLIPVSDETKARLDRHRRPGETDNAVLTRMIAAGGAAETQRIIAGVQLGDTAIGSIVNARDGMPLSEPDDETARRAALATVEDDKAIEFFYDPANPGHLSRVEIHARAAKMMAREFGKPIDRLGAARLPGGKYRVRITPESRARLDRLAETYAPDELGDVWLVERVTGIAKTDPALWSGFIAAILPGSMPGAASATEPRFATLFESFRRALVDTRKIAYPLALFPGRKEGDATPIAPMELISNPVVRKHVIDESRTQLRRLDGAHRFVLDDAFTELACDLAHESPTTLLRLMANARLPYPTVWIEWPNRKRRDYYVADLEGAVPERAGMLITTHPVGNTGRVRHEFVMVYDAGDGLAGPLPVGLVFSFEDAIQDQGGAIEGLSALLDNANPPERHTGLGRVYLRGIADSLPDELPVAEGLARHAGAVAVPPMGRVHSDVLEAARNVGRAEIIDRQARWLRQSTVALEGEFRWLLAVFGLMATHRGGEAIAAAGAARKTGSGYVKGKFLPPYEYRVVTLVRPMVAPKVIRALPSAASLGRRYHDVIGAWHHERRPTPVCTRHPRGCERATWAKVLADDGTPAGKWDQQRCGLCKRMRYWVPAHHRGDREIGVVDKGYEVTADAGARDHATRTLVTIDRAPGMPARYPLPVAMGDIARERAAARAEREREREHE